MKFRKNILIGLCAAVVFALLYIAGVLVPLEYRLYDFFLRFRANRPRINNVVFVDVDDSAIEHYGIFPWPRSVTADGLLRLKEYNVKAAVFDIEYIDRGPEGVDSVYLEQGLNNEFFHTFSQIGAAAGDIFSAVRNGSVTRFDIEKHALSFQEFLNSERLSLYAKTRNVARDNDLYLAQTMALLGQTWGTVNLRQNFLEGEQAERRLLAQEHLAYPVTASSGVDMGQSYIDVLPSLPIFIEAVKGAGFTNAEVDGDGVRRRIFLVQKIFDHWYLQLTFAPLLDYLGKPEIFLEKRKLTLKQAHLPNGRKKDIVIPLDHEGRMMLDWPKENFAESYTHISFAVFSQLDQIESDLELYSRALASSNLAFFIRHDDSLAYVPETLNDIVKLFDAARAAKNNAVEDNSGDSFDNYLDCRRSAYALLGEILALDIEQKIQELSAMLSEKNPASAETIMEESGYITSLVNALNGNLNNHIELTAYNEKELKDKFAIMGRVDTGTTDIGVNPFHGEYISVGTHAVVLDTILCEAFIIPLHYLWNIIVMLVFVPIFFIISARLSPIHRAFCGLAATVLFFAITGALFRFTGVFIGPLGTVFAMLSAIIVREIISYADSEKEKHFIRTAFSTYVSNDVVKEIISDPSRLQLGGNKRHMTAIFTDVKGFSAISEQLDPVDLVSLLNKYLSAMSDVVLSEKGTIDKYEGDAIIAFFGAPLDLSDHALRACVSAITMKKVEAELNKTIMEQKLSPSVLLTRIGINTGDMVAGNMGTANKMNYTIMGNAVNLAARLEGVNKRYGTWILASENTVRETGDHLLYRRLDRIRVVGINEPVRICELLDLALHADESLRKMTGIFHEALENFEKRDWKQAEAGFKEALSLKNDDFPSKLYLERCEKFLETPPGDTWEGIYNLTEK
jgi:adenylate cyclase